MLVPVFVTQDAKQDTIATGAEVIADYAFSLTAYAFNDINDVLLFGDGCKPIDAKLLEEIPPHFTEKPSGPSVTSNRNMDVIARESIKQRASHDFSILFQAHHREGRVEQCIQPFSKKDADTAIMRAWRYQ